MNEFNGTTVGQCIYCRTFPTSEAPLSDEHILPFAIYGKNKLRKASCRTCAAITSAFEGKVMQDLAPVRDVIGFPTRHKKNKKEQKLTIEIVTITDEVKTIEVTPEEAFPIIALPVFRPPAHLSKEPDENGIELIGSSTTPGKRSIYQSRLDKFAREHDAKEIAIYSLRWPEEWARMFAKVAYALAVRDYGLDRLKPDDVYVLKAILGKCDDVGRWVGGLNETDRVYGDDYNDQVVGLWEENGEIHAVIKLFAFLNKVPEYQVVVGKLSAPKE